MRETRLRLILPACRVYKGTIYGKGNKETHLADGGQREFQRELEHLEAHTRANQPLWVVLLIRNAVKLTHVPQEKIKIKTYF